MNAAEEAFLAFVEARGTALARTAYLLTGDVQRGEDALQDALAATYLRWRRLPDIDSLEAYVRRSLVTAVAAWWRRPASHEGLVGTVPDRPVSDRTGEIDEREVLLAALAALPRRQRAAVVLRYVEDLSEAQTAEVLGCSVGTVKTHVSRGLTRLRGLLSDADAAPLPRPLARAVDGAGA